MLKRSHPLLIYRRVKEQWLLRALFVSAPPAISHQTSLPTCTKLLAPYPATPPSSLRPPTALHQRAQGHPRASSFPCCPLKPLASTQVILLTHSSYQLVSLARKPVYLYPAPEREPGRKPVQASLFYRAVGTARRLGYPFPKETVGGG